MLSLEVEVNRLSSDLDLILRQVHVWQGQYELLDTQRRESLAKRHQLQEEEVTHDSALAVLQELESAWKGKYEDALAALGAQSLSTIWGKTYDVKLETTIKRGAAYLDIILVKDGKRVRIKGGSGGSVAQVLGATLAIIVTLSSSPALRPLLVWDEPFSQVAEEQRPGVAIWLRELAERLGLQMLLVSHEREIASEASHVYEIGRDGNATLIEIGSGDRSRDDA